MTPAAVRRPGAWALAAVPLAGLALAVAPHPPLTRDTSFVVRLPEDGAQVGGRTTLRWSAARDAARYAVVVDHAVPAPGARAEPGERVFLVDGLAATLELGPARSGSPSSRGFHTLTVVPLDGADRRLGEDVAVVHVRDRS